MSRDEQIESLKEFAVDVLIQYGMTGSDFECIHHGANTTFKFVAGDGNSYAIRIATHSRKWPEHTWAEAQWLLELSKSGLVTAPVPVPNLQGELFSNHYYFYQMGNLDALVYPWLSGEVISDMPTDSQLFEMGKAMATLHKLGKDFAPEGWANFLPLDKPYMIKRENLPQVGEEFISAELRVMFEEVRMRSEKLFEALREREEPQLIHADLQPKNVIAIKDGIAVLDFDDAGIGQRLQDLAIAIHYLRKDRNSEGHLMSGYESVIPLPEFTAEELELLIANRCFVLANLMCETTDPAEFDALPEFMKQTERRLKHYLGTGEFELLD